MSLHRNRVFDLADQVVTVRLYNDATLVAVSDSITYSHLDGSGINFIEMPRDAGVRASLIRIQVMFNAQANSQRRDVSWRRAD